MARPPVFLPVPSLGCFNCVLGTASPRHNGDNHQLRNMAARRCAQFCRGWSYLTGDPSKLALATQRMAGREPVIFNPAQQDGLFDALQRAAEEFHYELMDASIESWHLHWIIHHGFDPVPTMVGRLKNRMRQALAIGRIWTEGYYDSQLFEVSAIESRRRYVRRDAGCRLSAGTVIARVPGRKYLPLATRSAGVSPATPPRSGGLTEGV